MDARQSPPPETYALRVALQTMKERCFVLQKSLSALEIENQQLRAGKDTTKSKNTASVGFAAENFQLRFQLAELQREKTQLTEQINMVSTENRNLWSHLSQMAKDSSGGLKQNIIGNGDTTITENNATKVEHTSERANGSNGANQNLIRSKTFTQHSPNPNLRHKLISSDNGALASNANADIKDLSLNDVAGEEIATVGVLGFSYLNMEESCYADNPNNADELDFQVEAKKCTDSVQDLRREALQQQQELKIALMSLQLRIAKSKNQPCAECAQKAKKPEMADKSLETDESLTETITKKKLEQQAPTTSINTTNETTKHINFIQEKIDADARLKTCPMCGKIYNESISFQNFCEHVESHFNVETSDFGSMMEHDFECISNTIGNF